MKVAEEFIEEIFLKEVLIKNAWHFNEKYNFTDFEKFWNIYFELL